MLANKSPDGGRCAHYKAICEGLNKRLLYDKHQLIRPKATAEAAGGVSAAAANAQANAQVLSL